MKPSTFSRFVLLAGALAAASFTTVFAQDAAGVAGGSHEAVLTSDERAEYMKDTEQVLSAHPELKKEAEDIRSKRESMGTNASDEEKMAWRKEARDHFHKMKEAILKIDASAAPIFEKIDAHYKSAFQGGGAGGAGGGGQ